MINEKHFFFSLQLSLIIVIMENDSLLNVNFKSGRRHKTGE